MVGALYIPGGVVMSRLVPCNNLILQSAHLQQMSAWSSKGNYSDEMVYCEFYSTNKIESVNFWNTRNIYESACVKKSVASWIKIFLCHFS